ALAAGTIFLGGFGAWATQMRLAGATVVQGVVAAKGANLTIQHRDGGEVAAIAVAEGDFVRKGQALVTFDTFEATLRADRLDAARIALLARQARLRAERDDVDLIYDETLIADAARRGLSDMLAEQKREFDARRDRGASDGIILAERLASLKDRLAGFEAQKRATASQTDVLRADLAVREKLLKRQLALRSDVLALRGRVADAEGRMGAIDSRIGEVRAQMAEARQMQTRRGQSGAEQALVDLNALQTELTDVERRWEEAKRVVSRTTLVAPADGRVVSLAVNTIGAVVAPGAELLTLLPTTSGLVVEARLSPADIDEVRQGQDARLRFATLQNDNAPEVGATVSYVSADRAVDPITRESYYTTRFRITEELGNDKAAVPVQPGMPVDVFIATGERTFFDYIAAPLKRSMGKAFKET
ncbi:MAG: HlyD family type I secretion periplasmic adaptor subunit, partial [Pseudomonadota bacterium]